jgi:hypothetical protein
MADQNTNQPISTGASGNTQSNIDDLVKELSRPQNVSPTVGAPAQSGQSVTPPVSAPMPPKPVMPPRPTMPGSVPVAPPPVKPAIPQQPSTPTPAPRPYQSNIRTMADDLASLKSGQQPQGTTIPRMPAPAPMPVPAKPSAPTPAQPSAPLANVVIPKAVPTRPIMPVKPAMPAPAMPKTVPSPATPVMPRPMPTAPIQPTKPNPSQFYVPETPVQSSGGNHNLIFISIGAAVVVLGVLYWFLFIRTPSAPVAEVPTETLTPSPTATPRIPVSSIFSGSAGTIALASGADPLKTFIAGVKIATLSLGNLGILAVTASGSNNVLLPFDLFDRLLVTYPADLKPAVGNNDGVILAYGQRESFNTKGQLIQDAAPSVRVVFISQVSGSSATTLQTWESTMTDNLATLFSINKIKNPGLFMDTLYQGTAIRFKNFPNPDMSIDYALVPYNGATYLVMANSREAMFAAVSVLYSSNR